jgi:hypothetical protein
VKIAPIAPATARAGTENAKPTNGKIEAVARKTVFSVATIFAMLLAEKIGIVVRRIVSVGMASAIPKKEKILPIAYRIVTCVEIIVAFWKPRTTKNARPIVSPVVAMASVTV